MGVESGGDQNHFRLEPLETLLDQLIEYASVPIITDMRRERDIDCIAFPATYTDFMPPMPG